MDQAPINVDARFYIGPFLYIYVLLFLIVAIWVGLQWLKKPDGVTFRQYAVMANLRDSLFLRTMIGIIMFFVVFHILTTVILPYVLFQLLQQLNLWPPRPPTSIPV